MPRFTALRQHLISHTNAHPIFDASGLVDSDGLVKSFRNDILALPPAEMLKVITAIQAVRSIFNSASFPSVELGLLYPYGLVY